MSAPTPGPPPLTQDEREELDLLRAEVTRLRGQGPQDEALPRQGRARRWSRTALAALLLLVACALSPLSVATVWLRGEVTDTDRYVATVAPLAHDPAVQRAVAADLTDLAFTYLDVQGLTRQAVQALAARGALPTEVTDRLQGLAVPVASGVHTFVEDKVLQVVRSDAFAEAWVTANRNAHEQLVAALTGGPGGGIVVEGDAVTVNLAAFLDVVKDYLVANGFELAARIPEVNATFVVFRSADVGRMQSTFRLLDTVGAWLPLVLIALAGTGIRLAPNHRLAFVATGIGVAAAMLVAAVALALARRAYLDGIPDGVLPPDAAAVLFDTVVRFLRDALRAAFLIGLLVALGGYLTGPGRAAVTVRGWCRAGFAAARRALLPVGPPLAGAGRWVAPRARLLRGLVVACALGTLALVRYRTPELVGWTLLGTLAGLAVVEFLAIDPGAPERRADPAGRQQIMPEG